jgi:hypothetical protein
MNLSIKKVEYLTDYRISVCFNNGESGLADLSCIVDQGVFKALKAIEKFAQVALDEELETIVWPGGLDLAPEYVYFQVFKHRPDDQHRFKAWGYTS